MCIGWCSRGWVWFSNFCGVSVRSYHASHHLPCTHRSIIIGYSWWLLCIGYRCFYGWFHRKTCSTASALRAHAKSHWPAWLLLSTFLHTSICKKSIIARRCSFFILSCFWRIPCSSSSGPSVFGWIDRKIGTWHRFGYSLRSWLGYCLCFCITGTSQFVVCVQCACEHVHAQITQKKNKFRNFKHCFEFSLSTAVPCY